MYTHIYIYICIQTYVHVTCVYVHVHIYIYIHKIIHIDVLHTYIHMHKCTCYRLYMCSVCIHTGAHTSRHLCRHTYLQNHTDIHAYLVPDIMALPKFPQTSRAVRAVAHSYPVCRQGKHRTAPRGSKWTQWSEELTLDLKQIGLCDEVHRERGR